MLIIAIILLVVTLILLWREHKKRINYGLIIKALGDLAKDMCVAEKSEQRKFLAFKVTDALNHLEKDFQKSLSSLQSKD